MILILGQARSGTSAVSGILHKLGIDFGYPLLQADASNPNGYYTNLLFRDLHLRMQTGIKAEHKAEYVKLVERMKEPWALKCHGMYPLLPVLAPLLPITHVIRTKRDPIVSAMSLALKRGTFDVNHARKFIDDNIRDVSNFHHNFPVLDIDFCELQNPVEIVTKIAQFIGKPVTQAAIESLQRKAVVTLAVGEKGKKIHALSEKSQRDYAEKCNAAYVVIDGEPKNRFALLDKFRIYDQLKTYDRVLYLDADVIMKDEAPNLFSLVPQDQIGMCDEGSYGWPFMHHQDDITEIQAVFGYKPQQLKGKYFNSGIMLFGKQHKEVIAPPEKEYKITHCAEQNLINTRILQHNQDVFVISPDIVYQWFVTKKPDEKGCPILHYSGAGFEPDDLLIKLMGGKTRPKLRNVQAPKGCGCKS